MPATGSGIAGELMRLSLALAEALESGDLDAAERLVGERGRLLEDAAKRERYEHAAMLADARTTIGDADRRSRDALERAVAATRAELGALTTGARAVRAYLPAEPLAAGYVDRHD